MKVCIIQNVLDPFKGGNHLSLFAQLTHIEFTIVCNRSKVDENDLPHNIKVITVPGSIGSYYYGIADFLFARLLIKEFPVRSAFWKQFDVIHLNQVMGPALKKLQTTGKPLLLLIHHPVTADRDVSGWWLKYAPLIYFQKKMCRVADKVVTVSETMKKRIASDYRISEQKITVVLNGVDGKTFAPVSDADCTADVIAVGSFVHPRKGFTYLVQAYRELSASGRHIADVGRRSEEQLAVLNTISGVTVHGMVSEETLVSLMQNSRVLISTSQFEGFGLSLIEALACGHPAFAFDVGAVSEVLHPIDPQLLIPASDIATLISRVLAYLDLDPSERDIQGAEYRKRVLELYSLKNSAQKLENLYSSFS